MEKMDKIKEWAIMLCVVSVGCSFLVFLLPDGNLKKTADIVINLFLLSVVIIPFFGDNGFSFPDISISDLPDEEDYMNDFNEYYVASGELTVRQQMNEILNEICTKEFSVDVLICNDDDGNFIISEIQIHVDTSDFSKVDLIKNKVGQHTGIIPEVKVVNGDSESD